MRSVKPSQIIDNILNRYTNEEGLLSRTYPSSNNHLLSDLDDYLPFLLYYDQFDYAKNQVTKSVELLGLNKLVYKNGRLISYLNNEYIGGILHLYNKTKDDDLKLILSHISEELSSDLTIDNILISYKDENGNKSKIATPLSGGLLEVIIELSEYFPELLEIATQTINFWLNSNFYQKYSLFPSKYHISSSRWNRIFMKSKMFIPLKIQNRLGANFYHQKKWNDYLYKMPIGIKVQTAKDNTNLIFSIIELYRKTRDEKYKNHLYNWVKSFSKTMTKDNDVYRFWQLNDKLYFVSLDHIFPIIDILCDIYYFVERDKYFIELARNIIDRCLTNYLWENGLFPKEKTGKVNHIDIQTDFIVSLKRMYEITGDVKYNEAAKSIFNSILQYHYSDEGYVTKVDVYGIQVDQKIEPKYNALLLKAFILIEDRFSIYHSKENHSLMKDR